MAQKPLIAGIDAGGTTFKLGVSEPAGDLLATTRVPTTNPEETITASVEALQDLAHRAGGSIERLGVASFGPVDVDPASPSYGTILATPKAGWSQTPLLSMLTERLGVPGVLDTDVNGALEAEMKRGAARGLTRAAYITVGTGIGVGIKTDQRFAGRPFHPELGHVRVERHKDDLGFAGVCTFHGACLEGLCAAPALEKRFGPLEILPKDHEAWEITGFYLGQLCTILALGYRLEKIILGGGVLEAPSLLSSVQTSFSKLLNDYVPEAGETETLIARAGLGSEAGLLGAIELAR